MSNSDTPGDVPVVELPGGGRMPLLGFGTWRMTGRTCYEAVLAALEAGYRHIDTATLYQNEREVGRALADSGVPRSEVFITTKLHPRDAGREAAVIEDSLAALGTEYVDLWLIHWPPRNFVPVWRAMLRAWTAGLARDVGVSNFTIAQLDELSDATGQAPAVNQVRWGPSLHDDKVLAAHRERGIVLEGYSPLATTDLDNPVLTGIADRHGVTPAQVVLRWHIQHEIVAIPKSATPERVRENFDIWHFTLSDEEMRQIDGLSTGQ